MFPGRRNPSPRLRRTLRRRQKHCQRDWGLQPRLDRLEQLEARLVIARKRDDETDPSVGGGVGIAGERADAVHGAALVQAAVVAMEQVGMGREQLEHLGETARREPCIAADAGALFEMDGIGKAVRGEPCVCDLKRLLETDRAAELMAPDLQEDLVGGIIVRVRGGVGRGSPRACATVGEHRSAPGPWARFQPRCRLSHCRRPAG